jgi:hypothetical protein
MLWYGLVDAFIAQDAEKVVFGGQVEKHAIALRSFVHPEFLKNLPSALERVFRLTASLEVYAYFPGSFSFSFCNSCYNALLGIRIEKTFRYSH